MGKKLLAIILAQTVALTMGVSMGATAFGAADKTITVSTNFAGQDYTLYKLFKATTNSARQGASDADSDTSVTTAGIAYTLIDNTNHALTKEFTVTKADGSTATVKGADWFEFVNESNNNVKIKSNADITTELFRLWAEAYGVKIGNTLTAASNNDANIKWTGLDDGYYFITTTTGSLVTVDSVAPNAIVKDKNTVPGVDKTITGASNISDQGKKAMAEIGTDVTYTAVVTVGNGSKNLVFHDKMSSGLTLQKNSITVSANPAQTGTWYTIKDTPDTGDTLTITFKDGIAAGTKITIVYKATVNANALTMLKNDAKVSYGDKNTFTPGSGTEVYNAEIAVIKYDGAKADKKYLEGAGFKLKNSAGKYYKLAGTATEPKISWVDAIADGDEHFSAANTGKVPAFTGLPAGTYTLVETTTPNGYNTAKDVNVTIAAGNYDAGNLSQTAEIENQAGTVLPATGGIGTTIFYILGALLVIICGVVLVARRRMTAK